MTNDAISESAAEETGRGRGRRLWVPVWLAVVLVPALLLVVDLMPYWRVLRVRRQLMQHCTRGMAFSDYKAWVASRYPKVSVQEQAGEVFVGMARLGIPRSLLFAQNFTLRFLGFKAWQWVSSAGQDYVFYVDVDTSGTVLRARSL
jgi:hypothetical protein